MASGVLKVGVCIEVGAGGAAGHAEWLPGCFVFGRDVDEVLARMPASIAEFVDWLRRHGEEPPVALPPGELPEIEVLERFEAGQVPNQPGNRAALFELDRGYLADHALAARLRWLDHSRADLLALLEPSPPAILDAAAPGSGGGDAWTIRRILRHVADAEYGYARRIAGPWIDPAGLVDDDEPADVFERLSTVRGLFASRLGTIPIAERDRVIYPSWARRADEPWTLKKALRRSLEHEREHTQQISVLLYQMEQERAPKVGG